MTDTQNEKPIGSDFGDAVMVLMKSPRFRHTSLRDLEALLLNPMNAGQAVILRQPRADGASQPLGVILVAHLSDADDSQLRTQSGEPDWSGFEWRGGENTWFVMVEAPDAAHDAVLASTRNSLFPDRKVSARVFGADGKYRIVELGAA